MKSGRARHPSLQGKLNRLGWAGYSIVAIVIAITLAAVLILINEVRRDLSVLNSAQTDNVQWTLSQAEVEFLDFLHVLDHVVTLDDPSDHLSDLRREFDIAYSRVTILQQGVVYAQLIEDPIFYKSLTKVGAFLDAAALKIDAPNHELIAALPSMEREVHNLRPVVRDLATSGLVHFAIISDERRKAFASTLSHLTIVTAILMASLSLLAIYFNQLNRQNLNRGLQLEQANDRMNTVLSTSLDSIIVADLDGTVVDFNPAAEVVFGIEREQAIGRKIVDLVVPPEDRATHKARLKRVRKSVEAGTLDTDRNRITAMRATGEVFPAELALQKGHLGEKTILVAFLRDISDRVAAENALTEARDHALAGERTKAEFLAVMSHEIRTPLNGLLGNLTLMSDTDLSAKQQQYVRNMDISGKLLMNHVNNVLDITRFEAGEMGSERQQVNLGDLLQELIDSQHGNAQAQGNTLHWTWVGDPVPMIETDAQKVQQILLNLVGNAVKFTNDGQITVEVEVTKTVNGAYETEFRVIDTGIGIPVSVLPKVFDDFQTSDTSYRRRTGGTGLGLGIARRIARAMKGDIGAESTDGVGSVFWVRLPMYPLSAQVAQSATGLTIKPAENLHILVVEDNEINQQVVQEMLLNEGHSVTVAENGKTGVSYADDTQFDLILMDIGMPEMDGHEATKRIRQGTGKSRSTPILALSANVMPDEVALFLQDGMDGFLGKPLSREELRAALGTLREFTPSPTTTDIADMIDFDQFNTTRESLGDDGFAALIARFKTEIDMLCAELQNKASDPAALPSVAQECHKSASSAAVFGARKLRSALIELELTAKTGQAAETAELVNGLAETWAHTREQLSA